MPVSVCLHYLWHCNNDQAFIFLLLLLLIVLLRVSQSRVVLFVFPAFSFQLFRAAAVVVVF